MRTIAALFALTVFSAPVFAGTTSDHSQQASGKMMVAASSQLPNKGKAVEVIDTGMYTYIQVSQGNKNVWLAAPTVAVKKGDIVRFDDGAPMANFHSKTLNRDFPEIFFVGKAVVSNEKE
ncbi:MAG: hypothetical protein HY306_12605 [Nitrosomonadales bacterium]|nr:hypothetical protein [Nitrosomonadales bacterium]